MKYKKNIYLFILLFGLSLNFSSIVFAENEVTETQVSVELKQPISTKYHLPGTYNNGNELKKILILRFQKIKNIINLSRLEKSIIICISGLAYY